MTQAVSSPPARVQALLTLSTDWYWEQDADFRFTHLVPPESERGRDTRWRLGTCRWDNPRAHPLSTSWDAHREVLLRREPYTDFHYSLVTPDRAEPRYLSVSGEPVFAADGSFRGYRGITRDVTPQWQARDRLQDAQAMLRVAATLGGFGAWSIDVATGEIHCTDSMRALYKLPIAQERVDVLELYAPEHREVLARAYLRCLTEGAPFDLELAALTPAGERFWVRVHGIAVRDPAGRIVRVQGASQDIHRSKADAEAQRHNAEQLRSTLDSMADGFGTLDKDWRVTYVNPAALALLRLRPDDTIGRCVWDLFPQARNSPFESNYRDALAENRARRFDAFYAPLGIWLRVSVFPSGEGMALSIADITHSKHERDELARANAELEARVRERTAELHRINDELASFTLAVAHDLRAPLDAISGFSQALAERLARAADAKVTHYVERIVAGVSRMGHLIEGLVGLSRIGRAPMEPRVVDLTAAARDFVEDLRTGAPGRMVDAQVEDGLRAWGDPRLLHTVLQHLLERAWTFSAQREAPMVRVGRAADGAFFVHDNGAGFDMERIEELFLPFSRLHTDGPFPELGISLAAARRIVERHGGRIRAESSPDLGTTFWFTLADRPAGGTPQAFQE